MYSISEKSIPDELSIVLNSRPDQNHPGAHRLAKIENRPYSEESLIYLVVKSAACKEIRRKNGMMINRIGKIILILKI